MPYPLCIRRRSRSADVFRHVREWLEDSASGARWRMGRQSSSGSSSTVVATNGQTANHLLSPGNVQGAPPSRPVSSPAMFERTAESLLEPSDEDTPRAMTQPIEPPRQWDQPAAPLSARLLQEWVAITEPPPRRLPVGWPESPALTRWREEPLTRVTALHTASYANGNNNIGSSNNGTGSDAAAHADDRDVSDTLLEDTPSVVGSLTAVPSTVVGHVGSCSMPSLTNASTRQSSGPRTPPPFERLPLPASYATGR